MPEMYKFVIYDCNNKKIAVCNTRKQAEQKKRELEVTNANARLLPFSINMELFGY